MTTFEYFTRAFLSFSAIMSHLAVSAIFVTITAGFGKKDKIAIANTSCLVATGIFLLCAVFGKSVLSILGISIPMLRIAGGCLLGWIGFSLIRMHVVDTKNVEEECAVSRHDTDIAVTPLGVPMIAGPGCISTVLLQQASAQTFAHYVALVVVILLVMLSLYICFRLCVNSTRWLSPLLVKLSCRFAGLFLMTLAVDFILAGLGETSFRLLA